MEELDPNDPMRFLKEHAGRRYWNCCFDGYETESPTQEQAKQKCIQYMRDFGHHVRNGTGLILLGPKGTGKDHLLFSTLKALVSRYSVPAGKIVYRDGLALFAEFRRASDFKTAESEDVVVDKYRRPHLLAVSDPLPPRGMMSEFEMRCWLRVVDGRYRDQLPIAATLNVANRQELDERMGAQAADRLCDGAVVVMCNWASYRKPAPQEVA